MNRTLLHTPEGVRDIYGSEYAGKLALERKLTGTISGYGYEQIQTPTFEFFDVFSNQIGTTPSRELYKFFDKEGNTLVLRPDFTPSIARCAVKYFTEEDRPLRLSYVGNTFTNTSSLQGKLRETTQLGAELINDASVEADAEIVSMVAEALLHAGLTRFQISVGEVEYFKGLCEEAGLTLETEAQLREYISGKNYFAAQELLQESCVEESYRGMLLQAADMFGNMSSLAEARALVHNERSLGAIERLERLYEVLCLYGTEKYVSFDLGMLSQYHYYTGMIFRAYTYGVGAAVVKGGRYDGLLGQFGKEAPAVGFAIVVDDLMEALAGQRIRIPVDEEKIVLRYEPADFTAQLQKARSLRSQGLRVELIPMGAEGVGAVDSGFAGQCQEIGAQRKPASAEGKVLLQEEREEGAENGE